MCVRLVISIDGAHMRSEWKGTLNLATVKSAGDDLYPVAFAITVDGEDLQGWLWFRHLKASAPNLIAEDFNRECSSKLFTFMSDRCKGLTTARGNVFPANHNCYCAVHIRRNVEITLPPDVAARRMPGRPKTVRLRKNSHYAHEPEKSPTICSRCHQPSHNVRTCLRREAVKKRNAGNGAATISHSVL
ncbi:MULE transposase domain containing protein [Nitzschia inconspicua]|uniref:MULE transposase domain containing protein n=1 Tax=Nitzschia inconspicua TaxID=303405 RepID=A0A9K3Q3Q3_9STRA|nr:MULE transposase domain containing protein [Nitzschia inconspicua]